MGLDLTELWHEMSIIVKIITVVMIGMSVFMCYVIAERLLSFSSASSQTIRYVQVLAEYLRQNKMTDALSSARAMNKSPVARVMDSALTAYLQAREAQRTDGPDDVGSFDLVDSVNRALERVKERETANLRKGMTYLGTVASATPFIGLLGTVFGILETFQLLKGDSVSVTTIGPKISEALVSTGIGLAIAIIAAVAFNYFTSRVEQFVIDMNDISSEFIDHVLREGRG